MNIRNITICIVSIPLLLENTLGFASVGDSVRIKTRRSIRSSSYTSTNSVRYNTLIQFRLSTSSREDDNDELFSKRDAVVDVEDYEFVPIQDGEITDDLIKSKLEGAPSELEIMKEVSAVRKCHNISYYYFMIVRMTN